MSEKDDLRNSNASAILLAFHEWQRAEESESVVAELRARAEKAEVELARLREGIAGVLDRGCDNPAYSDLAALLEVRE